MDKEKIKEKTKKAARSTWKAILHIAHIVYGAILGTERGGIDGHNAYLLKAGKKPAHEITWHTDIFPYKDLKKINDKDFIEI